MKRYGGYLYPLYDSSSTCKLGIVFISVKYVLVSVKLMGSCFPLKCKSHSYHLYRSNV
jgi:hypothetical protein